MPRQQTLELSLIVRDAGSTLERCLESVAPHVDRILLGDTGSTDNTLAIARSFHAEILPIPWDDDFAAARNQLLAQAQCDWILVLDADELLDPAGSALLPELLADPGIHAYTLPRWDYLHRLEGDEVLAQALPNPGTLPAAARYPAYRLTTHTRLFRRSPRIRFEGCVHEKVIPALDRHHLTRSHAPLILHHLGQVECTPQTLAEKVLYYHQLAQKKARNQPLCFDAHLELASTELFQLNRPAKALPLFARAAHLRPHDPQPVLFQGLCHLRLEHPFEARHLLLRAEALGGTSATLYDALGDTFLHTDDFAQALRAYQRSVPLAPTTQAKIGVALVHLGQFHQGLEQAHLALARNPSSRALAALVDLTREEATTADTFIAV